MACVQVHTYAQLRFFEKNEFISAYFTTHPVSYSYRPRSWAWNILSSMTYNAQFKAVPYSFLEIAPAVQRSYMLSHEDAYTTDTIWNVPKNTIYNAILCNNTECQMKHANSDKFLFGGKFTFIHRPQKNSFFIQLQSSTDHHSELIYSTQVSSQDEMERCRACAYFGIQVIDFDTFQYQYYNYFCKLTEQDSALLNEIASEAIGTFGKNLAKVIRS